MIARALAQFLFAISLFQVAPLDASLLEARVSADPVGLSAAHFFLAGNRVHLPQNEDREILPPKKLVSNSFGVLTSADSAIVVDTASGATLFAENPDNVRPMGSITKLMTAMVFLDTKPDLNSSVVIKKADYVGGGITYLQFDDPTKLDDVLGAAMVGSDNTSAHALARFSGLDEETFVKKMNEKAVELRMAQSIFVDPSGISSENVSTARDLSALLLAAQGYPSIKEFMRKSTVSIRQGSGFVATIPSTNLLLTSSMNRDEYEITAGKTGYIPQAGYCLATVVKHDGSSVVIVVLGAKQIDDRFTDARNLAVWTFKTFVWPKR